jgi:uncharacterized secreted protein with C-terminal beta-propeller domain
MGKKKIVILILIIAISAIAVLSVDDQYCSGTLNRFNSYEELKEFLKTRRYYYDGRFVFAGAAKLSSTASESAGESIIGGYSQTNVQVEGVDEADFVKTDGEYIYLISNQTVYLVKAYPAENAKVLATISANGALRQLFINDGRLVVFYENCTGNSFDTFIAVYDVADRTSPMLKREVAADGCYFDSRMVGDFVYVIVRKPAYVAEDEVELPKISQDNQSIVTPADRILYSDISDYSYMFTTIVVVNAQEDSEEPTTETIMSGCTACMYVSLENIYLAKSYNDKTILHRFQIDGGKVFHVADGEVPGNALNQFSMDEFENHFRIATTSWIKMQNPDRILFRLQNNIYVLNLEMSIVGRIEGIAPGESIYSARFMGKRSYLVTFRKIDPFFVIDLSDPYNPAILGELKIAGYSDYLHPYDENHVIGIGKETIADESDRFSWYQGVKISLFDVSDVSNPRELAKYEIGRRGSTTPVLNDHKAFLFDRERNLLVMPVSVAEVNASLYSGQIPPTAFGEIVWQGAYVFTVSAEREAIELRGRITHIEDGDLRECSHYVNRALYSDNVLYTISGSMVKMNALADLSEINDLNLNCQGGN